MRLRATSLLLTWLLFIWAVVRSEAANDCYKIEYDGTITESTTCKGETQECIRGRYIKDHKDKHAGRCSNDPYVVTVRKIYDPSASYVISFPLYSRKEKW